MFRLYLQVNPDDNHPLRKTGSSYDAELDNIGSILFDICDYLQEVNAIEFRIEGFGQHPCPGDVRCEFEIFLENLPSFALWATQAEEEAFSLDFYEQGVERTLIFERSSNVVQITCHSRLEWQPDPMMETVELAILLSMLSKIWAEFLHQATRLTPLLVSHEWFKEWRQRVDDSLM